MKLVDTDVRVTAGTSLDKSSLAVGMNRAGTYKNETAEAHVEYNADLSSGANTLFITVLPKEGSEKAAFEV